jgi:acyl-CoA thioesterase FadM
VKRIKTRIDPLWDMIELAVPVHFSEVDSMKLVWHGHYLRYCESPRSRQ